MMNTVLLQAQGGGIMQFIPLILIFVVMYFFMIRPQMKKAKEAKKFIDELEVGKQVVTTGGIHGKITEIGGLTFTIQVDSNVKLKVDKSAISLDASKAAEVSN